MTRACLFMAMVVIIAVALCPCAADTWYVKWDSSGCNDGGLWEDAFTTIDAALANVNLASGDEIWVAGGEGSGVTYTSQSGEYEVPEGVKLFGGFEGSETSLGQRNWRTNKTVLNCAYLSASSSATDDGAIDGFSITGLNSSVYMDILLSGDVKFSHNIIKSNTGNWHYYFLMCSGPVNVVNNLIADNRIVDYIVIYCDGACRIINNTIAQHSECPAILCGSSTQISNNIIVNYCGIDASDPYNPAPALYNNCLYGCSALGDYINFPALWTPPITELVEVNPLLTADYHLESASPCLDSGSDDVVMDIGANDAIDNDDIPEFAMSKDLDCRDRIQGEHVDRGAYEADATVPTLGTLTSPQYSNSSPFIVSYSGVTDTWSGLDTVTLWYKFGEGSWTSYDTDTSGSSSGQFSFTPPSPSSNGTYYFALSAADKAGNDTGTPTSALGQTVYDTTAPVISTFSVPTYSSDPINITYQAADVNGSGIDTVELYLVIGATAYLLGDSGGASTGTFQVSDAQDGTTYTFAALAIDNAGNISQSAICTTTADLTDPSSPPDVVMDHVIPTSSLIHASWGASTDAHGIYCYAYQFWYEDSSGVKHNLGNLQGTYYQEAEYEFDGEYENDGMPYLSSTSAKTYGVTVYAIDNAMNWSDGVDSDDVECKRAKTGYLFYFSANYNGLRTTLHNRLTSLANNSPIMEYYGETTSFPTNIDEYDVLIISCPDYLPTEQGQLVAWSKKWHRRLILIGESAATGSAYNGRLNTLLGAIPISSPARFVTLSWLVDEYQYGDCDNYGAHYGLNTVKTWLLNGVSQLSYTCPAWFVESDGTVWDGVENNQELWAARANEGQYVMVAEFPAGDDGRILGVGDMQMITDGDSDFIYNMCTRFE